MSDLKTARVECMKEVLTHLNSLKEFYMGGSPAWVLIQNAWGHVKSVLHLETETNFDAYTLGVKGSEQKDEIEKE
jgi:hypothetical protein